MKVLAAVTATALALAASAYATRQHPSAPAPSSRALAQRIAALSQRVAALESRVHWMHVAIVDVEHTEADHATAIDCIEKNWLDQMQGLPGTSYALSPSIGSIAGGPFDVLTMDEPAWPATECLTVGPLPPGTSQPFTGTTTTSTTTTATSTTSTTP